jgi:hypothetical protein
MTMIEDIHGFVDAQSLSHQSSVASQQFPLRFPSGTLLTETCNSGVG